MEFRQLFYFVAVAEELHFGRAAERVHIAQPPLSQQIKKLEDELGVVLLNRTSRSVSLTPPGEVFLEEARSILRKAETAVERVTAAARGERGRIRIGFVGPAMEGRLPEIIRAFRRAYPDVSLDLKQTGTMQQFENLRTSKMDLGFMRLFEHDTTGLSTLLVQKEPYVLAVPENHELAHQAVIRLKDLDGVPQVFAPRNIQPALYDTFIILQTQAGFTPNIVQEATGKRTTVALVAAGLGVALVPASMAPDKVRDRSGEAAAGVVFRRLTGSPLPDVEISAVCRKDNDSPALAAFLEIVKENVSLQPDAEQPES